MEMKLLLITLPGLEGAVKLELEKIGVSGEIISKARIIGEVREPLELRTIEGFAEILAEKNIEDGNRRDIRLLIRRALLENNRVREAVKGAKIITVKGSIYCKLESLNYRLLELIAAREITRVFRNISVKPKVGDLIFRVEILNNKLIIAREIKSGLHKRNYTKIRHPAMINPLVAAAMGLLSNINRKDLIIDPYCGVGTIPIEICLTCKCEAHGSDINKEYVRGALINAKEANVENKTNFFISSIINLSARNSSYSAVITDPPRGIRLKINSLKAIYKQLINTAEKILKGNGKLIISALNKDLNLIIKIAKESKKFNIIKKVNYIQGGQFCSILILQFTSN